ncbi:MAG TPA: 4-(cytidine 5'-diphospho)-2-C-methyl-D-erythritol kinase [Nocardioides sp.]|nr:4-(cytidine 5'-diphospho)-2-C-methyl-D-erythritol kinase [Nocardioides sp.]
MTGVRARAAAKINLHLGVGGLRDDGYHDLCTVYQAITLFDTVEVEPWDTWRVETRTEPYIDRADVPMSADNIVSRAGALLAELHEVEQRADVVVEKAIPVAGGLAGGSADAAAALVVLDRLWELQTPREELERLAARLGSDVPFALLGGTGHGRGRGELVTPVHDPGEWWWVVVPQREGLSTPAVYRHFDDMVPNAGSPASSDAVVEALATGDARELAARLHNDLQRPVFDLRPDLRNLIALGESEGALRGLVSGSGPTCVFLCDSEDDAAAVADGLRYTGQFTALTASGPAPGPTVG